MPDKSAVRKTLAGAIKLLVKTIAKSPTLPSPSRRRTNGPDLPARPAPSNPPPLLTLSEAARHLGQVHRTTIMRWVKEGRLKCIRISRKAILFESAELDRFVREHRSSG